jgi:hypothetical protein
MEHSDYYIYVYLDPRKPGHYEYGEFSFDFEPFYVGKGRNYRCRIHLLKVKRGKYKNLPKYHTIKKIMDEGLEPIIIKYMENLEEDASFILEKEMIKSIGRSNSSNGPLKNLSDGGEGNGNRIFTEEHRKNLSLSKKGVLSENMIKNLKAIHSRMTGNQRTLGMKFSDETKKKMAEARCKPVYQIDPISHEILHEFKSIKEAEECTGFSIKKVLLGQGRKAGGFIWAYKDKK